MTAAGLPLAVLQRRGDDRPPGRRLRLRLRLPKELGCGQGSLSDIMRGADLQSIAIDVEIARLDAELDAEWRRGVVALAACEDAPFGVFGVFRE
jgi:hypothetical protein